MLKFGYRIVLDGLPDIPEFHFFWGLDAQDPVKSKCCIHILEILECLERHMSGSQACRDSPHGPIEKEICHLKAEKNKLNHSGCLLSQIQFHCFVCLCYMYEHKSIHHIVH